MNTPETLTAEQRQQINRFVAEKMGWTNIHVFNKWKEGGPACCKDGDLVGDFKGVTSRHVPNLFASLDHCHEAEKILDDGIKDAGSLRYRYADQVYGMCSPSQQPMRATAPQRAIALFLTLGGEL